MNTRQSILRGQKPNASHMAALQQADATLRNVREMLPLSTSPRGPGSLPRRMKALQKTWKTRRSLSGLETWADKRATGTHGHDRRIR